MENNFVIISFATGEPYLSEAENLQDLCYDLGVDFILYTSDWIKQTDFYKENLELFQQKKFGYCAWKPYIILDALKRYDKVLYLDSSMLFDISVIPYYVKGCNSISATDTPLVNRSFTKKNTFEIMGCNSDKYLEAKQVWAANILVSKEKISIIEEYLHYCKIIDCISDSITDNEDENFQYHLYDQSILSILFEKYGVKTQENWMKIGDDYHCLFFDTRERGHADAIQKLFGEDIMRKQKYLNKRYFLEYVENSSCF